MNDENKAYITEDDIYQIIDAACTLKACGLKDQDENPDWGLFIGHTAESLYELAHSLLCEQSCGCCECDIEPKKLNGITLTNRALTNDNLIVHLSKEDSEIAGTKTIGLTYNKYPGTKPGKDGQYLVRFNTQFSPRFLYYFVDRDEWAYPYDDWMPVSGEIIAGWLNIC